MGGRYHVGDWRGSRYDIGGVRWDYSLFLDRDGRFERTVHSETCGTKSDQGRWSYDEAERTLRLDSTSPDELGNTSSAWWVLTIEQCEDSNVLLVLREAILASRNLPIVFYRVYDNDNDRAYGTGWRHPVQVATEEQT